MCLQYLLNANYENLSVTNLQELTIYLPVCSKIAHEIAKPISYIINLSLQSGQVPTEWKTAQVIPLHKSGSKNDYNNYRPISILPVISKILEKAVHQQLMQYLEQIYYLSINLDTVPIDPPNLQQLYLQTL